MGNCLFGGMGDGDHSSLIRVTTSNGGVMEFDTPITVEAITDEFPGHGIFRGQDLFWKPLPHTHVLVSGESYHLLPLLNITSTSTSTSTSCSKKLGLKARVGHVRSSSAPQQLSASAGAPYRMSFDGRRGVAKDRVVSKLQGQQQHGGFWKVKLVISPEQLMGILAEEGKTEELIESVRTVAKCGSSVLAGGFSDHWSLSSSRNAASSTNKDSTHPATLLDF